MAIAERTGKEQQRDQICRTSALIFFFEITSRDMATKGEISNLELCSGKNSCYKGQYWDRWQNLNMD